MTHTEISGMVMLLDVDTGNLNCMRFALLDARLKHLASVLEPIIKDLRDTANWIEANVRADEGAFVEQEQEEPFKKNQGLIRDELLD